MKKVYHLFCVMLLATLFAGCVNEHVVTPDDPRKKIADPEVIIRISVPGRFGSPRIPGTRTLSTADESAVDNIYVFMFDQSDELVDIRRAEDIRADGSFSVLLPASRMGEEFNLVLLANAEDVLTASGGLGVDAQAVAESGQQAVMGAIWSGIAGPMFPVAGERIPMWGETGPLTVSENMGNKTVSLVRAVARIDVGVGRRSLDPTTRQYSWNGLDGEAPDARRIPFQLNSVYVVRPNDRYALAPDASNFSGTKASAPTLPAGTSAFGVEESAEEFGYTVSNGLYTTRSIYVPEADVNRAEGAKPGDSHHTERMALVVGGVYDANGDGLFTERESFYRIDFTEDGQTLDNVLRNHLYSFSVAGVQGPGMSDVASAYEARLSNMTVEVLAWDEQSINHIWFDGTSYFGIDERTVLFDPLPGETRTLNIRTNIPDFAFSVAGLEGMQLDAQNPEKHTFTSGDKGYSYTLEKVNGNPTDDEYLLSITNPWANVSKSKRVDAGGKSIRLAEWTIHAGRLQIRFDVDQDWTSDYVSLEDGQSSILSPEGTDGHPILLEIVELDPSTVITVTDPASGDPVSWIDLGGLEAMERLTTDPDGEGYFHYRRELEVAPFRLGPVEEGFDGLTDRTALITVVTTEEVIRYTVTQEAPYLRINRDVVYVQRPDAGTQPVVTTILVYTNVPAGDLELSRVSGDAKIVLADPAIGLETYDPRRPRNLRFGVQVNFDGTDALYETSFEVAPNGNKYGQLLPESVGVQVPPGSYHFNGYWTAVHFGNDTPVWEPEEGPYGQDITLRPYIFPWNTTRMISDAVSNIGIVLDPVHTVVPAGSFERGEEGMNAEGDSTYRYNFTLENRFYSSPSNYTIAFVSTRPEGITGEVNFRLGQQVWERTSFPDYGAVSYTGYDPASPASVTITNNVRWSATSSAPWLKLRAVQTDKGGAVSGDFASTFTVDDRLYAPEIFDDAYEPHASEVLVNHTELQVAVDNWYLNGGINPTPNSRQATITFRNEDYSETYLGASTNQTITVTQWGRILRQILSSTGGLPNNGSIPKAGGRYTFAAGTNIDGWSVKIFDVTNPGDTTWLATYPYNTTGTPKLLANESPEMVSLPVTVPPNTNSDNEPRQLFFALSPNSAQGTAQNGPGSADWALERGVLARGTWIQLGGEGLLAPPGVLGVGVTSGKLTLRGSQEFAGTSYLDDSPSSIKQTAGETVYVVYFKWGSFVGLGSVGAGEFRDNDIAWLPDGYPNAEELRASVAAATTSAQKWAQIPRAESYPTSIDWMGGLGDPCMLTEDGRNYHTPPGNPWNGLTPGALSAVSGTVSGEEPIPVSGYHSGSAFGTNGASMLMTYAGRRAAGSGTMEEQGATGYYWSRTASGSDASILQFNNGGMNLAGTMNPDAALAIRCVYEEPDPDVQAPTLPLAYSGILAPPGVLGVGATTGMLTLRGSREYGVPGREQDYPTADREALMNNTLTGQPVSSETVYVAFFKRGSLIATGSDQYAGSLGFNLTEEDYDIVWAPPGFDIEQIDNWAGWADVPYAAGATFPANDPTAGLGDPCNYADGKNGDALWMTPTAGQGQGDDAWRRVWNPDNPGQIIQQAAIGGKTWVLRNGSTVRMATVASDPSMYLVMTGYRSDTGMTTAVDIYNYEGDYWASDTNFTRLRALGSQNIADMGTGTTAAAYAIRCVPKPAP